MATCLTSAPLKGQSLFFHLRDMPQSFPEVKCLKSVLEKQDALQFYNMARGEASAPILYNIPVIIALAQGRSTGVQFYFEGIQNHTEDE